jgi:hypothetical protein
LNLIKDKGKTLKINGQARRIRERELSNCNWYQWGNGCQVIGTSPDS